MSPFIRVTDKAFESLGGRITLFIEGSSFLNSKCYYNGMSATPSPNPRWILSKAVLVQ